MEDAFFEGESASCVKHVECAQDAFDLTDPEWLADRLVQQIAAQAAAEQERQRARTPREHSSDDDAERRARRHERERAYEERVVARARDLDLGAALAAGSRSSTPTR